MYSFRLSNCHATKIKMQTWTIRGYVRASKCGATMAWCIRHWNYLIIYMTIEVTGLGNGVDWRRNILGFLVKEKREKGKKRREEEEGKKGALVMNAGETLISRSSVWRTRWIVVFDVKGFRYSTSERHFICELNRFLTWALFLGLTTR